MKYKRHVATGVLVFSLLAGGVSAFAADMTASTTKINQYTNQVRMKSSTKQDKLDSLDTSSTKKFNRTKHRVKNNSVDGKVDAKDATGKDIETIDDMIKNEAPKHTKVNNVHKSTTGKTQPTKNPVGNI